MTPLVLPPPGVFRHVSPEEVYSIVDPIPTDQGIIYIGNKQVRRPENMPQGVVAIVDASNYELPPDPDPRITMCLVNINDDLSADLTSHLDRATKFIWTHLQDGHVVVHCYAGKSRSVAITAAFLMRFQGMTLDQAWAHIKHHRPCIDMNPNFHYQLKDYEKMLATRAAAGPGAAAGAAAAVP